MTFRFAVEFWDSQYEGVIRREKAKTTAIRYAIRYRKPVMHFPRTTIDWNNLELEIVSSKT